MRIDLPQCNLKTCRYCADGNCTDKNRFDVCEYTFVKNENTELKEMLDINNPCYDCLRYGQCGYQKCRCSCYEKIEVIISKMEKRVQNDEKGL